MAANLDHYYLFGDVYRTLEACDELELRLGILRRLRHFDEQGWRQTMDHVNQLRSLIDLALRPDARSDSSTTCGTQGA